MSIGRKTKIVKKAIVWFVLTYPNEIEVKIKETEQKIKTTETRHLKLMMGITQWDKKRKASIRSKYQVTDVT